MSYQADLEELREMYQERYKKQDMYQFRYQTAHYILGYPQIVCSALLTYFTGIAHINWATGIGLIGTLLSVSIVFFKLQEQAAAFRTTKLQYEDLISDIDIAFHDSDANFEEIYRTAKEKEQYIISFQRKPLSCCLR